ncbi:MAG: NADAR family protein, partial [Myxococcota bacterium]|nr:NADAR family protein [Myxococcota bacterium]
MAFEFIEKRTVMAVSTPFYQGPARTWPFYSHQESQTGHAFSNLYPCEVSIDTSQLIPGADGETLMAHPDGLVTYASTEHIFQCAKALHARDDRFGRTLSTGGVARYGQGRFSFSGSQRRRYVEMGGEVISKGTGKKKKWIIAPDKRYPRRAIWADIKLAVMWLSLQAKFTQHPHLWGDRPSDSAENFLIEHTGNDVQWGDAGDGTGTNFLGKLLSTLLWSLRTGEDVDPFSEEMQRWLR